MSLLPIGPWRPDMADTVPGVSRVMQDVLLYADPAGISVGPRPGSTEMAGSALPSPPLGLTYGSARAGNYYLFAGTVSSLYKYSATYVPTLVTGGYAVPTGDVWSFAQFGDYMVATNRFDGQTQYNLETSTGFTAISGAPKARILARIFQCMFALDCDGDNRLMRNSDIEDQTNWVSGLSGYQTFVDGDELLGAAEWSDGLGVVIQRNCVRLLTKTNDERVYEPVVLAREVGATNPQCIVHTRGASYFVNSAGFFMATPDGVLSIGKDKINLWFKTNVSAAGLRNINGAYDPKNELITWAFETTSGSAGITYDPRINEFVELTLGASFLATVVTPSYTLEDLDAFGTLDSLAYSLDDSFWSGKSPLLGIVANTPSQFTLSLPNGATSPQATVETSKTDFNQSMLINSIRVVTDARYISVQTGVSDNLYTSPVYAIAGDGFTSTNASGRTMTRARGKNVSFKVVISEGDPWTYLRGVDDLDMKSGGSR